MTQHTGTRREAENQIDLHPLEVCYTLCATEIYINK
jgi:hypothetical protein